MNNVDLIITYLSGEMDPQRAGSFEKELESDPDLKREFEHVSIAYHLIRDQLQRQDDEEFRTRLAEVMERNARVGGQKVRRRVHWGFYLLPLAGGIALLLALFLHEQGHETIFSRFYHPEKDAVILAMNQGTRGSAGTGILRFREGNYQECSDQMERILDEEPGNQAALLYYLLASMETGSQEQALMRYDPDRVDPDLALGQSVIWYASLALVKSGRTDDAAVDLDLLVKRPGPYRHSALRMQKMLLK